jgi:hypothetical protein
VDYYQSQIDASVFLAPFAGRVSAVRTGKQVFEMVQTDTMRIVVMTEEADIGEVQVGAAVNLKVRAYPRDTFSGEVTRLAVSPYEPGEKSIYEVYTAVPNDQGLLRPGMTGYAKISCGDRRIISIVLRKVIYFFRMEFWSWW